MFIVRNVQCTSSICTQAFCHVLMCCPANPPQSGSMKPPVHFIRNDSAISADFCSRIKVNSLKLYACIYTSAE